MKQTWHRHENASRPAPSRGHYGKHHRSVFHLLKTEIIYFWNIEEINTRPMLKAHLLDR